MNKTKFIDQIPDDKIRAFAVSTYNKLKTKEDENSDLLTQTRKLNKKLGIQEDGFVDTPSLNRIMFDQDGRPYCEEHGAMNCYEHRTYRCVACGVAISMENRRAIVI